MTLLDMDGIPGTASHRPKNKLQEKLDYVLSELLSGIKLLGVSQMGFT